MTGGTCLRARRWLARLCAAASAVLVALVGWPARALADDGARLGQTPAALIWIHLTDSHGISVWNYEMSLDRGGMFSAGKVIWSTLIDFFWQLYRAGVVIAIWLIDWVLSFGWLTTLATPVSTLSRSVTTMVDRFGLPPVLLTIAATVAVVAMARGRWALGITELFTSLIISSLALGVLANPVALVAGNNGMIMASRNFGLAIAGGLAHDGQTGIAADQMRKDTTALLADTFVRLPAETLNFGTVLDGGKCQGAYDTAVKGGPYGDGSQIRDAVAGCDSALGDVAANPGSGQAISAAIISPAAALVLVFAIVLAGAVLMAGLSALYQSLKAIVTLVSGLLPGPARGPLWHTVADLVMSLVTLVFAIVFLTGYLLLIQAVFRAGQPGDGVMATFFFVDILLVAGTVLFWRGRKSLRRGADRLAQVLATRPGGGAQLPQRRPFDPAAVYYRTRMAAGAYRGARRVGAAVGTRYGATVFGLAGGVGVAGRVVTAAARYAGGRAGRWRTGPGGGPGGGPGRGSGGRPAGAGGAVGGGAAQRLTAIVQGRQAGAGTGGRLLRLGTRTALAVASGGATTAATAVLTAGKAATATPVLRAARRAALAGQLSAGQRALPPGPPRPRTAAPSRPPDAGPTPGPRVRSTRPLSVGRTAAATPADSSQRLRAALEARRSRPLALPPVPARKPPD